MRCSDTPWERTARCSAVCTSTARSIREVPLAAPSSSTGEQLREGWSVGHSMHVRCTTDGMSLLHKSHRQAAGTLLYSDASGDVSANTGALPTLPSTGQAACTTAKSRR